jgi:hypothetical protein
LSCRSLPIKVASKQKSPTVTQKPTRESVGSRQKDVPEENATKPVDKNASQRQDRAEARNSRSDNEGAAKPPQSKGVGTQRVGEDRRSAEPHKGAPKHPHETPVGRSDDRRAAKGSSRSDARIDLDDTDQVDSDKQSKVVVAKERTLDSSKGSKSGKSTGQPSASRDARVQKDVSKGGGSR